MDELFLLPAARSPLTRIFVGGNDIMLAYINGKARVWNVETREFRRSTGFDSAEDMLGNGTWTEVPFHTAQPRDDPLTKVVGPTPLGSDLVRLLQLDLRVLGKWLHREPGLEALRGLLAVFLTFGINSAIDDMCTAILGITPPAHAAAIGLAGKHGIKVVSTTPTGAWRVSPTVTGLRQLTIVTLLRPFLDSAEHESAAADVIAFYTACLPPDASDASEADLELFTDYYLDSAPDVHQAARMLFAARLSRIPNEKIEQMVGDQQSHCES
jgi:hypothetical protein